MKKPKIEILVTKEDTGYSATATVGKMFISTEAENFDELKNNIVDAVNLAFDDKEFSYILDEIKFSYDLQSFFEFYNVINVKALSARIGMNQSLLAQYIKGIKKPSAAQTNRIIAGVQQIGRELTDIRLVV